MRRALLDLSSNQDPSSAPVLSWEAIVVFLFGSGTLGRLLFAFHDPDLLEIDVAEGI